ncbi:DUF2171 domain-containing protein [Acinetobacter terrae]|uniref:DUF2171 domain-containing protein n=1 Tax=Acinetobacter terrae TaxID=2731247 RepID=A0A4R0ELD4_9GAMM|nr:DUF2171 domain-containing protein [Acinetobacter terrae]NNG77618.1 DUF2171 domain-containing protein [Acinetobacter terrae]NNH17385.1 DUF2171 domain-containing protein [Acinetobacter terrae]NNH38624.1 DUF2171 domain-containing protein [Acinetobacter terrae]NNH78646.1 DUF2171 domain-containing protein [Acinetobacter terrae]OAL84067.1 hypothetical protein AY608_14990 [Acinetobacter terrae]
MATINVNDITKHADVIASCGTKVGTVDHLDGSDKIKLTRNEEGSHHLIPLSWVSEIKDNQVLLNVDSEEVKNKWVAV